MAKRLRLPEDLPAGLLASLQAGVGEPTPLRTREVSRVRFRLAHLRLDDVRLMNEIAASVLDAHAIETRLSLAETR
jgi:hypothetical protein